MKAFFVSLTILFGLGALESAFGQGNYEFTKIASSGGRVSFVHNPVISDNGTIAYYATFTDGNSAIYSHQKGITKRIVETGDEFSNLWAVDVNDSGLVAFNAISPNEATYGIFGGYGGESSYEDYIKFVVQSPISEWDVLYVTNELCLNNSNEIAFGLGWNIGNSSKRGAIYVSNGTSSGLEGFLLALDNSHDYGDPNNLCINDRGVIAVLSNECNGCQENPQSLYKITRYGRPLSSTNFVARTPDIFDWIQGTSINNNGEIAFRARPSFTPNSQGIYVGTGGEGSSAEYVQVSPAGKAYGYQVNPSINHRGQVAFGADYIGPNQRGIYTGDDPVADKVIEPGDFLDGRRITSASTDNGQSMNKYEQIVFGVTFDDDSTAIYLANPPVQGPKQPKTSDLFGYPVGQGDCSSHSVDSYAVDWDINHKEIGPDGTTYPEHTGEDWNRGSGRDDYEDPVCSIGDGTVVVSSNFGGAWGNVIVVEHKLSKDVTRWSQYAHLKDRIVAQGAKVKRGIQIGTIGDADGRYSPHLHLEVRKANVGATNWPFDPNFYLDPSDKPTDLYPDAGFIETN